MDDGFAAIIFQVDGDGHFDIAVDQSFNYFSICRLRLCYDRPQTVCFILDLHPVNVEGNFSSTGALFFQEVAE